MINAGQLTEEQKKTMEEWAAQGASIADIQRKLKEQFGLGITYMEARFLVLDLGLKLHDESKKNNEEEKKPDEEAKTADGPADGDQPGGDGSVSVTMDEIALPGAIISGKVTFSDGQTAVWLVDHTGRPGIDPDTAGYRPSETDIMEFQRQLQSLLRKKGMY